MGMLDADILSDEHKKNIREYKYRGGDNSIAYKYVLSPMAQYLVDNWTPAWLAPNAITFIGFLFNVMAVVLTVIYDPTLRNAPFWLPYFTAFCLFVYQTLDNMDGKQARKIGASSPLGLLFDHGCDAISAGMTVIPLTSVFGAGWTATGLFTAWVSAFLTFYVQTWEEYYLGEMFLPMFNGCSEGLIVIIGACVVSGIYGPAFWQTPSIQVPYFTSLTKLYPFQLLTGQVVCLVTPSIMKQISTVLYKMYKDTTLSGRERSARLQQATLALFLITTFVLSMFFYCFISESAFSETPYAVYFFMMAVFTEMATHMMLMHMTGGELNSIRRVTAWSSILIPLNCFYGNYANVYHKFGSFLTKEHFTHFFTVSNQTGYKMGTELNFTLTPLVNEAALMRVLSAMAVTVTAFKLARMIASIADVLGIYVFVLGKKPATTATAIASGDDNAAAVSGNGKDSRSRRDASPKPDEKTRKKRSSSAAKSRKR